MKAVKSWADPFLIEFHALLLSCATAASVPPALYSSRVRKGGRDCAHGTERLTRGVCGIRLARKVCAVFKKKKRKKKRSEIQSAITEKEGTCGELLSGYGCRSDSPTCTHSGPHLDPTTKAPPLARSRGWIPWINYCPPLCLRVINSMKWAIKGLRSGNRGGRLQRWSGGGTRGGDLRRQRETFVDGEKEQKTLWC